MLKLAFEVNPVHRSTLERVPYALYDFGPLKGQGILGEIDALDNILERTVYRHPGEGGTMILPGNGRICDEYELSEYCDMLAIVMPNRWPWMASNEGTAALPGEAVGGMDTMRFVKWNASARISWDCLSRMRRMSVVQYPAGA